MAEWVPVGAVKVGRGDAMKRIRAMQPDSAGSGVDVAGLTNEAAFRSQLGREAGTDTFRPGPAMDPGEFARGALPSVAAAGAEALFPASIPLALLASFAASSATDAGIQTARGQVPDATSLGRGVLDAGGGLIGRLLKGLGMRAGHGLMKSALSVTKPIAAEAVDINSQLAGRKVMPHEIDLPADAIRERIAPLKGPKALYPESGAQHMNDAQDALMKERNAILANLDQSGVRFTRQDFTQGYSDLLKEVESLPNGSDNVAVIKKMMDDYLLQGRTNPSGPLNAKGNVFKKLKPSELEDMKEKWADFALKAYKGNADATLPMRDRFSEFIAENVRRTLEGLTPPQVTGGVGDIARLNRAYRANIPLTKAMENAEMPRASLGSIKDLNPLHLASPGARGRAALFLTEPATQGVLKHGPRAAGVSLYELMQLLRDNGGSASADSLFGGQ